MKKIVGLLVLINLGLLAYFNSDLILPSKQGAEAAMQPEKIKLLNQAQVEALPKIGDAPPTASAETVSASIHATHTPVTIQAETALKTACYEWGVFSATNLTMAQAALAKIALPAVVKEQSSLEAKRFWVYKQPLKSEEAAQAKAIELKALGVEELYVVQEAKWKNAISFGVFEDEQLATKLLNELKAKGVRNVVKALHNQGKEHASLIFTALASDKINELQKLKSEFPEANLKEIACH